MNKNDTTVIFQNAGIVGAGGAGFPTYAKIDKRVKTMILNCAECEPLLKLDQQLLAEKALEIIRAFKQIADSIGAEELIIGIKKSFKLTIASLLAYLGDYPEIRLGLLDEIYPAGDEIVLIYELTGKVIPPGHLPLESGIAVFNVETIYNAYCCFTNKDPVTEKWVTVAGEVKNPVTVRVPLGISASLVVKAAGGSTIDDPVYFFGGPMMGSVGSLQAPITKTTNAILVLPENHLLVNKKRRTASLDLKRAAACCCQCMMCTDLCPRYLLGHPVEPHRFMQAAVYKDIQQPDIFLKTLFCPSCGLCENFACRQGLSPRSLMADYKAGLRNSGVRQPSGIMPLSVKPDRKYKQVKVKRLLSRLDLLKYEKDAPMTDISFAPKKVRLLLSQHIGSPSVPVVSIGDKVEKGQLIAAPGEGLSVALHASLSGTINEITKHYIEVGIS
ncbi:MAG: SLBB domain-containing protein [Lachnospiraceae bacterium]|nr:SLBB domain-containing protein [Lachnospiraceae bacterium]